jgi:hypothetical protein
MYSFRKTTRKSSVEAGGGEEEDDNNSVFSVDPEMITKLKIPIRVDQRSALDYQKMYIYQIEKDLVKIVRKHGPHARRNQNFLEARAEDPEYRTLSNNHPLGMNVILMGLPGFPAPGDEGTSASPGLPGGDCREAFMISSLAFITSSSSLLLPPSSSLSSFCVFMATNAWSASILMSCAR